MVVVTVFSLGWNRLLTTPSLFDVSQNISCISVINLATTDFNR